MNMTYCAYSTIASILFQAELAIYVWECKYQSGGKVFLKHVKYCLLGFFPSERFFILG